MNTKERVERLKEIWQETKWAEDAVDIFNEDLTEDEFQARHVESVDQGSGRWYRHMLEVIELDNHFFVGLCWDSGLTESQENMYDDEDVYLVESEVIQTIDWTMKEQL